MTVEGSENLETEGGYAKETSDDFKKKQEDLLTETLKKIDIIICTALIPGKKAPVIIKDNMISHIQPGSVIYDLAAVQGGNTAFTEADKIVEKNGIKIMGESNILNNLPISASNLYAKNMYYVVWSVTPSLHTPLMSVTNAISSVIIVGAIIAGLSGNAESIFNTSSTFGFLAIALAAINIFGGFLVTQRMLAMYKKKKKDK